MSDLKRLHRFAGLIGIPIKFKRRRSSDIAGYFVYAGRKTRIEIFLVGKRSDHYVTLVLLHELGHALHWIEMGRPGPELVPDYFNKRKLTKKDRYQQWVFEREAVNNMKRLHALLNLKLSHSALETERMFDLWVANEFYRKGKYPTKRARKKKWAAFQAKALSLSST